jgi:hypothetical protein
MEDGQSKVSLCSPMDPDKTCVNLSVIFPFPFPSHFYPTAKIHGLCVD